MKSIWRCACCVAMAGLGVAPLHGQFNHRHAGFWLALGAGGGVNTAQTFEDTQLRGGAFYLRMGGTLKQQVLFGGEVIAWGREADGADLSRANATATVLLYPLKQGGPFLKGGFGIASAEINSANLDGVGSTFGAGIDLRVARNFYVTPNVDVLLQFFDNNTNTIVLFTLGGTWH